MGALFSAALLIVLSLTSPAIMSPPAIMPPAVTDPASPESINPRQEPSRGAFVVKSKTVLVTVDVTVRTDKGAHVGDLQPENFTVYDNGVAQEITLLARERLPLAVALLIDSSPSVQPYLEQLRNVARIVLERLKPEDELALCSFDMRPALVGKLTRDRGQIAELIGRIPVGGGGTIIYDALYEAAAYLHSEAPDKRHAILLISDNFQTVGSFHAEEETLKKMLEASVTFYSIRTRGTDSTEGLLDSPQKIAAIAEKTGGEVLSADTDLPLFKALEDALMNLRAGYVLGFTPSDLGEEGGYHQLAVELSVPGRCPDCRVQARAGYYAPAAPAPSMPAPPPGEMESYRRTRSVVDLTPEELLQTCPDEVRGLRFAENQEELPLLLQKVGENVERFFRDLPKTVSREQVRRERLGFDGRVEEFVVQNYSYTASMNSMSGWQEGRTDSKGNEIIPEAMSGLSFLTAGFAGASLYFHPKHQFGCRFRLLGQESKPPNLYVIAFAQQPGVTDIVGSFLSYLRPTPARLLYQGLAWVNPATNQIVRLQQRLLAPRNDAFLAAATSDISYAEVRFQSAAVPFWLPKEVVVSLRFAGQQYRNRHRYSDYQLFTVTVEQKITPPAVKKQP